MWRKENSYTILVECEESNRDFFKNSVCFGWGPCGIVSKAATRHAGIPCPADFHEVGIRYLSSLRGTGTLSKLNRGYTELPLVFSGPSVEYKKSNLNFSIGEFMGS